MHFNAVTRVIANRGNFHFPPVYYSLANGKDQCLLIAITRITTTSSAETMAVIDSLSPR
jgi:hypothetical protein